MTQPTALLRVEELVKHYPVRRGAFSRVSSYVRAVDGISFQIMDGQTLGLVGESGCGKTTAAKAILRLEEATSGKVFFDGIEILNLNKEEMRTTRRDMQIVFQDPYSSLNPRMTIGDIIGEPLKIHNIARGEEKTQRVQELLETVGLSSAYIKRYPHEFSGGQRQRVGVARALALNPRLIVLDEPVSALDMSIQAQVINLLADLQDKFKLTYLFIAHDLSVIRQICHRVAVMYLGKIVEMADTAELFGDPQHPYTRALLSAVPVPDPSINKHKILLSGNVPSPINPPWGCRFHTRCPYKVDICTQREPQFKEISAGHYAACHLSAQ